MVAQCRHFDKKTNKTCKFEAANPQRLIEHKLSVHKYHKCDFVGCGQALKNYNSLRTHMLNHTHSYRCTECNKILDNSGTASTHLKICKKVNESAKIEMIPRTNAANPSEELEEVTKLGNF